jgi:CheY-like chemotaxis protein
VVSFNRVVAGLEPMLRRLIGEDVELVTCLGAGLWSVRIDPNQLEQVIVNLLVNAREAMPTGGRITLETGNAAELGAWSETVPASAGERVLLAVTDTGPGIPPEIRGKIFEPFFTTKAESGNSGLGLATVYGIVEQAGGHVWVYSEPGRGATFKVYLPRCLEPGQEAEEPRRRRATGGTERILLVEDEADVRRAVGDLLTALGYEVATAGSTDEARRLVADGGGEVDLVITDVVLPGTSGHDLAQALRRGRPDLKVLFISGYTDNVVLRHGILAGEVDFLGKPFSAEQLAHKVREILDRRRP